MFTDLTDIDSLARAHRLVMRGKQNAKAATLFDYSLMTNLLQLQRELRTGTYRPLPYRSITIYEPKLRHIQAPAFRDRIVHQALYTHLEPLYERRFIPASFACRTGKGTHQAVREIQRILRSANVRGLYVCSLDISKYFASINHGTLKRLLARVVDDTDVLQLLGRIIDSADTTHEYDHLFPADSPYHTNGPRGLPIGNLTSQLFANVYLHHADSYAKQKLKIRRYIRYMDDILFFHEDKQQLLEWQQAFLNFLHDELQLVANPRKVRIYPAAAGVAFVGFHVFPGRLRLRGSSVRRFKKRYTRQLKAMQLGTLPADKVRESLAAYTAHARHAGAERLIASLHAKYEAVSERCGVSPSHHASGQPHRSPQRYIPVTSRSGN